MARRKSLFRRILDHIRRTPEETPPKPPPPPPPPPKPPEAPEERHNRRMREIYEAHNGGSDKGYDNWYELFEEHEVIFDGNREIERYWDMFLRAFMLDTGDPGHIKRETFYNRTGIPRSQIDWPAWRDLTGSDRRMARVA